MQFLINTVVVLGAVVSRTQGGPIEQRSYVSSYSWMNGIGSCDATGVSSFQSASQLTWAWGSSSFSKGSSSSYSSYCPQFNPSWSGTSQQASYPGQSSMCSKSLFKYWVPACQSGFQSAPQCTPVQTETCPPYGSNSERKNPSQMPSPQFCPQTSGQYTQIFSGVNASMSATGYNTVVTLSTGWNITECLAQCDGDFAQSCQFVEMYEERNQSAVAQADGTLIASGNYTSSIKCTLYDTIHYQDKATNTGYGNQNTPYTPFLIEELNGTAYGNYQWTPPVVTGYTQVFSNLTKSVGTPDKLSSATLSQYIPQMCATLCSSTSGCAFFNLYRVETSYDAYSPICDLYAFSHQASDCNNTYVQSSSQTISGSYGWVNSTVAGTSSSGSSASRATSSIKSANCWSFGVFKVCF